MEKFPFVFIIGLFLVFSLKCESKHRILVLTSGIKDEWIFVSQEGCGEHLIYGACQIEDARLYYYKGLTQYNERFNKYLYPKFNIEVINLDKEKPEINFKLYDLVILDDVRGSAFKKYDEKIKKYVENGGKLLLIAGRHMLGGHEGIKGIEPKLPLELLFDAVKKEDTRTGQTWRNYLCLPEETYFSSFLNSILPVKIISYPDYIVKNRKHVKISGEKLSINIKNDYFNNIDFTDTNIIGYHRVILKENSLVHLEIGEEKDPLLIEGDFEKGKIFVFTGCELEASIRWNGSASASSIVSPDTEKEILLWENSDIFWRKVINLILNLAPSETFNFEVSEKIKTGETLAIKIKNIENCKKFIYEISPVGASAWLNYIKKEGVIDISRKIDIKIDTEDLPVGKYRIIIKSVDKDSKIIDEGVRNFRIIESSEFDVFFKSKKISYPGELVNFNFEITNNSKIKDGKFFLIFIDKYGNLKLKKELDWKGDNKIDFQLKIDLKPDFYGIIYGIRNNGKNLTIKYDHYRIKEKNEPINLFFMVAGDNPSYPVYKSLLEMNAIMTVQQGSLKKMLPYAEVFGGIPRLYIQPQKGDVYKNWEGKETEGTWGEKISWNSKEGLDFRNKQIEENMKFLKDTYYLPYLLFDDEPSLPIDGLYEECSAKLFREKYGIEPVKPEAIFSYEYLDKWIKWEDFRIETWKNFYLSATEIIKKYRSDYKTGVVVEGMGKDVYAGFEGSRSQLPLDIYWLHIYPLNQPLLMVSFSMERGISSLKAMGSTEKNKEIWALLQNWSDQSNVPHIPPPEYIKEQFFLAISHGAHIVGYWPYAYGWWIVPGTENEQEFKRISEIMKFMQPILKNLNQTNYPIGLLYSSSQGAVGHLKSLVLKTPQASVEPWHNWHSTEEAYYSLKMAQLPFRVITEEEIISMDRPDFKILILPSIEFVRKEMREKLIYFAKQYGITIYGDKSTTLKLDGTEIKIIKELDFNNIFNLIFPPDNTSKWNEKKHREYYKPFLEKNAEILKKIFASYIIDYPEIKNKNVVWNILNGGIVDYFFVINDHSETKNVDNFKELIKNWRHPPQEFYSITTDIKFKNINHCFELDLLYKKCKEIKNENINVEIPKGEGKVFILINEKPSIIDIKTKGNVKTGEYLPISIILKDKKGNNFKGVLPIKVNVNNKEIFYLATEPNGICNSQIFIDRDFKKGKNVLIIEDLVTGLKKKIDFFVKKINN